MIIRKYPSDFGTTYVQAEQEGIRYEFAFDHDPTDAEVEAILDNCIAAETIEGLDH